MATPFKVFGTNALRTVLIECLPAFERAHDVTVAIDFAATNHMLEVVRGGGTADVICGTAAALDDLARGGKIIGGTCTHLATAGIGACVRSGEPRPDISTVDALKRTLLDAKSVSYSKAGQSGLHFAKVIDQLGIGDAVRAKAKINPSGLVGEVIVRGEADLGFQQTSEILAVKGVDLIGVLPDAVQLTSLFAAGIGSTTGQRAAAEALIKMLTSASAQRIMRENGLTPV